MRLTIKRILETLLQTQFTPCLANFFFAPPNRVGPFGGSWQEVEDTYLERHHALILYLEGSYSTIQVSIHAKLGTLIALRNSWYQYPV